MFYGRERELRQLREEINKQGQKSAVLIYGKRRVGKSTLIREAAKSFHGVVTQLSRSLGREPKRSLLQLCPHWYR